MQRKRREIFSPTLTFKVFYKIFSERKLGIIATYITLTLSFLQLIIFVFQAFLELSKAENDFVSFMYDATSYVYMVSLVKLNKSIYFAVRILLFILAVAYFLLFLIVRWLTAYSKTIKGIEKLFDILNSYYTPIALLPTTEIAFREIFCDPQVMIPLEQVCGEGIHIFTLFCAVISFLLALIMCVITVVYSLNGIYDKKNYFSGENRLYDGLVVITKVVTAVIISTAGTPPESTTSASTPFTLIYLGANLLLSVILLLCFIFWYPYNKIATEYFALMWLSIYFTESLAFMAYIIIGDDDLTSFYILIMLVVTAVPALFFLYVRLKLRLVNKDSTSSTTTFLLKVQNLLQLKQGEKIETFQEVHFRGIVARHIGKCTLKKCFCKEENLFDSKKHRYVELDQWHYNKALMLKYYVRHLFEEMVKLDPLHPDLLISYAEFLFEKFRNTHLALYQIMKVAQSNKFLHPYHRFKIYKLKQRISDYINVKNTEALEKTLEIESVIFIEEQLNKVVNGMREIITNSLNFWSYLVNKDLDLDKLSGLVQKMHDSVENTDKLWVPLKKYLRKQKKLLYFYNWFLKDFLHRRIMLNEEEIDELFDNETFSVYSNDFIHIIKDDNIIFQEDSAIIHMSGNHNELGKIIKTNRTASKIFKYTKDELEKSHVNILMPKMIAEKHNSYLESYIYTGKTQVLYNQRKTFAKDKEGFIVPIWLIVKQLDNPDGQIQYVGLLRPLSQKKDEQSYYILMNNFGEISGISKNLTEHLKLPGDIFQKKLINVVLLAPKLIKYSYFAKLLHDEREKKINESEEIDHFLIRKESEKKKEPSKIQYLFRKSDKSPFMSSAGKVSALKDFLELDNLNIDGIGTTTKLDGEKSPREEETTERNLQHEFEDKEIEFTFRLPQKLNKFLKEFQILKAKKHGLLNNQQMLINAVESKDLLREALKRSDSNTREKPTLFFKKKAAFHLASYKHAVDSYVEALRTVSNQIARSNSNNVYRIKGVIVTDQYGPENDIIKYIKIVEITKKVEKFSEYQIFNSERTMLTPKDDRRDSSGLTFFSSQSERVGSVKSKLYTSTKTIRPSAFKTFRENEDFKPNQEDIAAAAASENDIPKENADDVSPGENDEELESPASNHSKKRGSNRSDKSSKKDEDEDAKSKDDSIRQNIMTDLKNNLLAPFQSIYQKEDNLQISNNFRSLNNVKWFIRVLFLAVIPINICLYFTGPNVAFSQLDKSVNDIYLNEDLRKDYLRAHDAIVTLMLENAGKFDSLKTTIPDKIDDLVDFSYSALGDCYANVRQNNSKNEWTSVLYNYLSKGNADTSLNYKGLFSNLTVNPKDAMLKLTNSLSQIAAFNDSEFQAANPELLFYRSNSFQKFNNFLTDVTTDIFASLQVTFDDTEQLSSYILIAEGVIFFLSFFGILRLIIIVIQSLKKVLNAFTDIEDEYLNRTQKYYQGLQEYLEAAKAQYINENVDSDIFKRSTRDINSKLGDHPEVRGQKKLKKVNDKTFMREDSIKILGYYMLFVILSCSLAVALHVETLTSLNALQKALVDGQTFLQLNPIYIVTLVALKELFYDRSFYAEFNLPYMQSTLTQLDSTLNRTLFKSDLQFVSYMNSFMDGAPCETFKDSLTSDEYNDCKNLGLGRLANGLITFHNYFGYYITGTLALQESNNYGDVTIDSVYEFGQLLHIIDGIFMENTLTMWRNNMEEFLTSKEQLLIILIVAVSVLNVIVFVSAEKGVVGTLNNKFLLYRKIFNKYMLAEALAKQNIIKSGLMRLKILNN